MSKKKASTASAKSGKAAQRDPKVMKAKAVPVASVPDGGESVVLALSAEQAAFIRTAARKANESITFFIEKAAMERASNGLLHDEKANAPAPSPAPEPPSASKPVERAPAPKSRPMAVAKTEGGPPKHPCRHFLLGAPMHLQGTGITGSCRAQQNAPCQFHFSVARNCRMYEGVRTVQSPVPRR